MGEEIRKPCNPKGDRAPRLSRQDRNKTMWERGFPDEKELEKHRREKPISRL